jgi:hypothetical protein
MNVVWLSGGGKGTFGCDACCLMHDDDAVDAADRLPLVLLGVVWKVSSQVMDPKCLLAQQALSRVSKLFAHASCDMTVLLLV